MAAQADSPEPEWQVVECLLPGLTQATAEALGQRVTDALAVAPHPGVSYLGSLLMPEDEVLLCLFGGPPADVRSVSERASLPFERIVGCVGLGWQPRHAEPGPATTESGARPRREGVHT